MKRRKLQLKDTAPNGTRLNKYIANAGITSRRGADDLITDGVVAINGKTVTQVGTKVFPNDQVTVKGKKISAEAPQYVLLNKPKDFITTTKDEKGRKTVMQLVNNACKERIYPVGRLDRNTTGLLLFTNDGEVTKKLSHPSSQIKKIYKVKLDVPVTKQHIKDISEGTELEDGLMSVDQLAILTPDNREIGIEIHSGKNRIVRRLFEHYGYKVVGLDRTVFAGLTKKDLPRGKWRHLSPKEIRNLKHFA